MCFLEAQKPTKKPKQPPPKPRIYCPFQSQPSNLPHYVAYPPPPPPPPSPPCNGWTRPKPKPKSSKPKKPAQEMTTWHATNAYGYPPPSPPFDPSKFRNSDYSAYEQQKELERYRAADKAAKQEHEKAEREAKEAHDKNLQNRLMQIQFEQGKELDMFKARQWHRDDQFQNLMLHTLSNKLSPAQNLGGEGKGGREEREEPWKKDLGALRKEVQEERREREIKEAIARAKAESRKEFEAENMRKGAEENSRRERSDYGWQRGCGRRQWEADRRESRGRKALEDRFEDLAIFGHGFHAGTGYSSREVAPLPPTPRRPQLGYQRPEYGYGYGNPSDDGLGYNDPMPWGRSQPPHPGTSTKNFFFR